VKRNLTLNISNFNNNNNTSTVDEQPSKKYRSSNDYNDLFDNTTSFTNNSNTNASSSIPNNNIQSSSNSDISFSYDLYKIIDDENLLNDFSIDLNSDVNAATINVIYQNVS
jgi:hypothetical protein